MLDESEIDKSILAVIGKAAAWIFKPLGWGNWQAAVARKNKKTDMAEALKFSE